MVHNEKLIGGFKMEALSLLLFGDFNAKVLILSVLNSLLLCTEIFYCYKRARRECVS